MLARKGSKLDTMSAVIYTLNIPLSISRNLKKKALPTRVSIFTEQININICVSSRAFDVTRFHVNIVRSFFGWKKKMFLGYEMSEYVCITFSGNVYNFLQTRFWILQRFELAEKIM